MATAVKPNAATQKIRDDRAAAKAAGQKYYRPGTEPDPTAARGSASAQAAFVKANPGSTAATKSASARGSAPPGQVNKATQAVRDARAVAKAGGNRYTRKVEKYVNAKTQAGRVERAKAGRQVKSKPVVISPPPADNTAESTADIYRRITGSEPGAAERSLTPQQYREQILNQFEGSPQLGNVDVSRGYAGRQAQATLDHLLRIGPQGYVGVNSGQRDDREYASVLDGARRYAAMPTGERSRNPHLTAEETAAGEAEDARVEGYANDQWTRLAAALGLAAPKKKK